MKNVGYRNCKITNYDLYVKSAKLRVDLLYWTLNSNTNFFPTFKDTDYRWKWFDINSGKWCPYSSTNNTVINKAFWDGDSTVRITAGRRRYVINFNAMIQLNEETSNRRPITLWLADPAPVLPSLQYLPTTNRRVGYSEKMTGIGPHPLVESEDVRPKDPDRHTFLGQGRGTTNSTEKQMRYTREKLEFFKTLLRDDVHDLVK